MKKLLAITVIFALITGAVFAEASVGGNFRMGQQLFAGNFLADGSVEVGASRFEVFDMVTNVSFGNATNGGMMRLYAKSNQWQPNLFGFVFFRPIDQIRIQAGHNPDGDFGAAQISAWGFNGEAQGGVALDEHRLLSGLNIIARTSGWDPGFNSLGLTVSVFPVHGLAINIGIPFIGDAQNNSYVHKGLSLAETYGQTFIQGMYTIEDIGIVRLSAKFNGWNADDTLAMPNLHASFFLMAVENMGVDVGFSLINNNIKFGLGYRLNAGDLVVKARAGLDLTENAKAFGIHILPSYKLGDITALFNAGFAMSLEENGGVAWYINPYITIAFDSVRIYTGIQLFNNGDNITRFGIPLSFNVYF